MSAKSTYLSSVFHSLLSFHFPFHFLSHPPLALPSGLSFIFLAFPSFPPLPLVVSVHVQILQYVHVQIFVRQHKWLHHPIEYLLCLRLSPSVSSSLSIIHAAFLSAKSQCLPSSICICTFISISISASIPCVTPLSVLARRFTICLVIKSVYSTTSSDRGPHPHTACSPDASHAEPHFRPTQYTSPHPIFA